MGTLSESEKKELKNFAYSAELRADAAKAADARRAICPDEFVAFLNAYNGFVNHQPRRFRKIEGSEWRV